MTLTSLMATMISLPQSIGANLDPTGNDLDPASGYDLDPLLDPEQISSATNNSAIY